MRRGARCGCCGPLTALNAGAQKFHLPKGLRTLVEKNYTWYGVWNQSPYGQWAVYGPFGLHDSCPVSASLLPNTWKCSVQCFTAFDSRAC